LQADAVFCRPRSTIQQESKEKEKRRLSMRKNISVIASILACVLLIISLCEILSLKNQIDSMRQEQSRQMSNVYNTVNNLYSGIDSMLSEQTNLLATNDWEYGALDADAGTVEFHYTVMPKEFVPGKTTASLVVNGEEIPMEYADGRFTTTTELSLFADSEISTVMLYDDDAVRVQSVEEVISPRYEWLANCYASLSGSASGSAKDGVYNDRRSGTISVDYSCRHPFAIVSCDLIEMLDGKEVSRIALDSSDDAAYVDDSSEDAWMSGQYSYDLDKTYQIPFGSMQELVVELRDESGLRYRTTVARQSVDENGSPDDSLEWAWYNSETSVYSADGELLYDAA
jgi:hypothetical protein